MKIKWFQMTDDKEWIFADANDDVWLMRHTPGELVPWKVRPYTMTPADKPVAIIKT